MQKTFCDWCGELISPEQMHYFYKGTLRSSKRPTPNTWVGTEPKTLKVDLCQTCFGEVWPLEKITRQNAKGMGWAMMPDWISAEDKLPDNTSEVIVWSKNGGMWLGYYNTRPEYQCWMKGLGERLLGITHWMPLPEPPREGK